MAGNVSDWQNRHSSIALHVGQMARVLKSYGVPMIKRIVFFAVEIPLYAVSAILVQLLKLRHATLKWCMTPKNT